MPVVHFDTVTKQFSSDSYGVKEVSFAIEPGELVFVTGPSGSGKTTLMRLLLKEYTPTDGEIFFNDTPISSIRSSTVHLHRRKIGTVFQDYKLIPELNVWENIAVPLYVMGKPQDAVERRVTDLLNLIKLPHKAELFPSQLSGGEAQRVSIARSLAAGPELIMADEPTGNLDSETAHSIIRLFHKINELGTTILIATHDKGILDTFKDRRRIHLEFGELKSDTADTGKSREKSDTKTKSEPETTKDSKKPTESDTTKQTDSDTSEKRSKKSNVEEPQQPEKDTDTTSADDAAGPAEVKAHTRIPFWKRWFAQKKSEASTEETDEPEQSNDSDADESETDQEDEAQDTERQEKSTHSGDSTEAKSDSAKTTAKEKNTDTDKDDDASKETKKTAAQDTKTPAKSRTSKKETKGDSDTASKTKTKK